MDWFSVTRTMNVLSADQVRGVAGQAASLLNGVTLLLVRRHGGVVEQYCYGRGETLRRVGGILGFTITRVDRPQLPEGLRVAHALIPFSGRLNRAVSVEQVRTDESQAREGLEASLGEDSFAAVTFRHSDWVENARIRDWVSDEQNSTPDSSSLVKFGRLLARVTVGDASDPSSVVRGVASCFMPLMSHMTSHRSAPRLGLLLFSLVGLVLFGGLTVFSWLHDSPTTGVCARVALMFLLLTVVAVGRWANRSIWVDILQHPRHRWWWVNKRGGHLSGSVNPDGSRHRERERAYPVQRSTLIVDAYTTATLFTPTSGGRVAAQDSHPAPEALTHRGVYVGDDETGRQVYLDDTQLYRGVAVLGKTGSGKSVLLDGVMQWADSHREDTDRSIWGEDSRLVDMVMKDDSGVKVMQQYRQKHNLPAGRVVRMLDPDSPCFDLLGLLDGLDARTTGGRIASRMQYSYNQGDIMKDSLAVLGQAFTIATACARVEMVKPGKLAEHVRSLEPQFPGCGSFTTPLSPVGWAYTLLGGSQGGVAVARAITLTVKSLSLQEHAPQRIREDCAQAVEAASQLYGVAGTGGRWTVSDSTASTRMQAARNKVDLLAKLETVFDMRRARIRWQDVLSQPGDYHIVLAPDSRHAYPDDNLPLILGSWLTHMLWEQVRSQCDGWQEEGKHTMVVCDELSMLAQADAQSLVMMKEQGRSFGLVNVFATQYPNQLPDSLLESFLGYDTIITFDHPNRQTASMIASQRFHSVEGDGWDGGVIQNLPLYHAAVRTRTRDSLQPAFIVRVHDFSRF